MPCLDVLPVSGKVMAGDVLHQSRHAHPATAEQADDAVEGIACVVAEEHGLSVFNGWYQEEHCLVFLQRCPALLAAGTVYHLRVSIRIFLHGLTCLYIHVLIRTCLYILVLLCQSAGRRRFLFYYFWPGSQKIFNSSSIVWLLTFFLILV